MFVVGFDVIALGVERLRRAQNFSPEAPFCPPELERWLPAGELMFGASLELGCWTLGALPAHSTSGIRHSNSDSPWPF